MDNGWSNAIEVGKLPEGDERPVVVDMDPAANPVLFWAGKRNRREVPVGRDPPGGTKSDSPPSLTCPMEEASEEGIVKKRSPKTRHRETGQNRASAEDNERPITGPKRRDLTSHYPIYSPPGESTSVPDVVVTIRKRRPRKVQITGYIPLRTYGHEDVSWKRSHPGHTKLVPLAITVHRSDLRDLAAAVASDIFRELFFIPAFVKAGPRARGPFARAARVTPMITAIARRLRFELENDPQLLNLVKARARKAESPIRTDDRRDLVAYMLDEVWGKQFDRLRLRRPVEDVEVFAKRYLPQDPSVGVQAAERSPRFLDFIDAACLTFDPSFLRRLLDRNLIVEEP
jgi:hypothetical protein